MLLHPPLWEQAQRDAADEADYDFGPLYASIAPAIEAADLAICQLETPVSDPGGPFAGWPRFTVPPQVLTTLREIGYDSCTTASNHTLDAGVDGVIRTADALEAAGLAFTGSARSADEGATPLIMSTSDGVHVGQLAYTYSFNGLERPAEQPWLANPIDIPTILADAAAAHEAGADIVALSMHWGVEYDHLPSELQRQQADELLASPDIDVIFGAHAHVVQPAEKLHDKWVFYSMGNQVARHADPIEPTREGMMPLLTFTENDNGTFAVTEVEVIPTWMQLEPDLRLINLAAAVNSTTDTDQADQYAAIIERIGGYVNAYQEKVPIRGSVGQ